ncbi:hypothetical protein FX988_04354 (plasmid) [Paraglaciecola mesophila]|uniref:Uncharacterized protein n=2 Tax=Paraglaciecola mesophila TaxID=197222 RepID=A0A857JRK1_9ALTE|nr:hypothetical protein FX988_04354 [Paraglaciecola mesophila]
MLRSVSKSIYRLSIANLTHSEAYDFLPTKNFICADLTKQYASIRQAQGIELAKTLVLRLVQAYTSFTSTNLSGTSGTTYTGIYNDSWGQGSWVGYGTSHFNGYSRANDYSFIGNRATDLLDLAFSPNANIKSVETALEINQCEIPWY